MTKFSILILTKVIKVLNSKNLKIFITLKTKKFVQKIIRILFPKNIIKKENNPLRESKEDFVIENITNKIN